MHIAVDKSKCVGIGMCELSAPAVFEVGDDAQTHVIGGVAEQDAALIDEGVGACPTGALTVVR